MYQLTHTGDAHTKVITINDATATITELGYEVTRFEATAENIQSWMNDHPNQSEWLPEEFTQNHR